MRNSKEERMVLYNMLYVKLSKATAEIKNEKREDVRLVFVGKVKDLFQEIKTDPGTIAKFLWAVSHKTDVLPTVLFRIVDHGVKGLEISRIHSGFYDAQRKHITGSDLVPFIIKAAELYKPTPRAKKESVVTLPIEAPKLPEYAKLPVSPDQLTDAELDTAIQELQATLNAFVSEKNKRAEEELKKNNLLKALQELAESEGYSLEELMKMV